MASLHDHPANNLSGEPASLGEHAGKTMLIVNVASKCGFTPQYEGLQALQERYGGDDFTVVGFPCNQFLEQEPGTPEEIQEFCRVNYAVTFPLYEKIEVNGEDRHPVYDELTAFPDAEGEAGDVKWNFEKFLVSAEGDVVGRFRTGVEPEAEELVGAIEAQLGG